MFTSFKTLKINDSIFKFGEVMVMEKLNPPGFDIDCFVKNKTFTAVYRKRINPFGIPYKGNIFINLIFGVILLALSPLIKKLMNGVDKELNN